MQTTDDIQFAIKYCCCSAALFGKSISQLAESVSLEYTAALKDLLSLPDEAWASKEYAWANSGRQKPCALPRPCRSCILDKRSSVHIHGFPEESFSRTHLQE